MGKYNVFITGGGCRIGSIAVGNGAVANGSVNVGESKTATHCDHCGAPIVSDRDACPYCKTAYAKDGSNVGAISISYEG